MLSRLATFAKCDLPVKHPVSLLASIGYVYEANTGQIICGNCRFVLENFQESVNFWIAAHQKWNPNCSFSNLESNLVSHCNEVNSDGNLNSTLAKLNLNNRINISTISDDELETLLPNGTNTQLKQMIKSIRDRWRRRETNENKTQQSRRENTGDLTRTASCLNDVVDGAAGNVSTALHPGCSLPNISLTDLLQGAKHPSLISREARRQTFNGKEGKYQHCRATLDQFIDAGFFFVGPQDNVRCFYCDGGLKNFKAEDNPWLEHKRWFRDCRYVDYKENQLQVDRVDGRLVQQGPSNSTADALFNPKRVLEARELKARLETPMIQTLLALGYQRDHIRRSLGRRFALVGDDYTTVAELVDDIIQHEGDSAIPTCRPSTDVSSCPSSTFASEPPSCAAAPAASIGNATAAIQQQQPGGNNAAATNHVPRIGASSAPDHIDGAQCAPAQITYTAAAAENVRAPLPPNNREQNTSELTAQEVVAALKDQTIEDEELRNLWKEYEQLTQSRTCKVCLDQSANTVFLPCGHFVCCDECTPKISHCCICRSLIRGTVRVQDAN